MTAKNSIGGGSSSKTAKNSISGAGELLLYGEIGSWWDELDAESVVRQLEYLNKDEIIVRIHSGGGLILEGLAIYNRLVQSTASITIYIDGLAASMASVIAMAGDVIRMPSNSWLMIHKPWNNVSGNADDMRRMAENLDGFEESTLGIYMKRFKGSEDELKEMLRNDTWINAKDALEMGFIDEITDAMEAAASIDLESFSNVPEAMRKSMASIQKAAQPAQTSLKENEIMTEEEKRAAEAKAKAEKEQATIDAKALADEAVAKERMRVTDIQDIGAKAKIDIKAVNSMISRGITADAARSEALDAVAKRDAAFNPSSHIRVEHDMTAIKASITNAILNRSNPSGIKLSSGGSDFRGMTLMELARSMIESTGISARGLSPNELAAKAMHSTSDFPAILADVTNQTLRAGYEAAPKTFMPFCRQTTATNFKDIYRAQLGEAPELEKVNEKGEFKYGTLGEGRESYKLATTGKIIALTRQTLINDDMDAFTRIPQAFGASAAEVENSTVWGLITANANMSDNVKLFHASHKNLGTPGALSETTLSEARKNFRRQTGVNTKRPLNLEAKFLIVPAALETAAQKILTALTAHTTGDVNVFANSLTLIVEPRLDDNSETAWYLAAEPMRIDTIEYAYLAGEEGIYIETQQGFDVDGIKIKARLDFGAGAIDHRGIHKNAGV